MGSWSNSHLPSQGKAMFSSVKTTAAHGSSSGVCWRHIVQRYGQVYRKVGTLSLFLNVKCFCQGHEKYQGLRVETANRLSFSARSFILLWNVEKTSWLCSKQSLLTVEKSFRSGNTGNRVFIFSVMVITGKFFLK